MDAVNLFAVLAENGCELLDHFVSENVRRIDPLEFPQHVQRCLSRTQLRERRTKEVLGFLFDHR